jgi:type II restriction enzyme
LVEDALNILAALGIPLEGTTDRRKIRMAKAFLSVAGMKPGMTWAEARSDNRLRSRDVIRWMNEFLDEDVSSGSYDDIRRKDLLLPVEAGIVLKSAGKQGAATNDGTRPYALSPETATLLHTYRTPAWNTSLSQFLVGREALADQLKKLRQQELIPVVIGSEVLQFGPGEHNALQKTIIEDFLPRFGFGAEVLYVGDTEDKLLFCESAELHDLGFFELSHDKLPDVLAYSRSKKWLFLIEAVHSANPITELRKRTLGQLTKGCAADIIYVSAFLSRAAFRRFAREIAWETEVWIAESPDHLIHFNGDKFLGPHVTGS